MCKAVSALSLQALVKLKQAAKQYQCTCNWRVTREKVNDMATAAGWVAGN